MVFLMRLHVLRSSWDVSVQSLLRQVSGSLLGTPMFAQPLSLPSQRSSRADSSLWEAGGRQERCRHLAGGTRTARSAEAALLVSKTASCHERETFVHALHLLSLNSEGLTQN